MAARRAATPRAAEKPAGGRRGRRAGGETGPYTYPVNPGPSFPYAHACHQLFNHTVSRFQEGNLAGKLLNTLLHKLVFGSSRYSHPDRKWRHIRITMEVLQRLDLGKFREIKGEFWSEHVWYCCVQLRRSSSASPRPEITVFAPFLRQHGSFFCARTCEILKNKR